MEDDAGKHGAGRGQSAASTASAISTPATSASSVSTTRSRWRPGSIRDRPTGAIVSRALDETRRRQGLSALYLKDGKVQGNLVLRWLDDALRVETKTSVPLNRWQHVMLTYDGSRLAERRSRSTSTASSSSNSTSMLDDMNQRSRCKSPCASGRLGAGEPLPGADRRCPRLSTAR